MPAPEEIQRRHRPLTLVGSQAASLTPRLQALRTDLNEILRAGVATVDPFRLVRDAVSRGVLDRFSSRPASVVSAGKAAWLMACGLADGRSSGFVSSEVGGIVAGPRGPLPLPEGFEWFDASHPSPDAMSEAAGRRALELASRSASQGGLLVLLSGGASALMAVPADGLSLADKMRTARALMKIQIH